MGFLHSILKRKPSHRDVSKPFISREEYTQLKTLVDCSNKLQRFLTLPEVASSKNAEFQREYDYIQTLLAPYEDFLETKPDFWSDSVDNLMVRKDIEVID